VAERPPERPEEERKRRLEELKRRLRDLRARIERWAMLKISDVAEMNAVYREIGEVLRELAKLNPHPEAERLKREAEQLREAVKERLKELGHDPEAPREVVEKRRRFEDYVRGRVPRVYRFDWTDLRCRISYHAEAERQLLDALREVGAVVERVVEARPPLKVAYVDFSKAKLPPPLPEEVERRWREMAERARRLVEEWIRLYVARPEKAHGVRMALERALRDVESTVKELLRAGKPEMAEEELRIALKDVARVVVSVAPKAREHPEIQWLLPEVARPPALAPPVAPPIEFLPPEFWSAAMKPPGLGREAWKWARFLAKVERYWATRATPSILSPGPAEHPNPYISAFPPGGVVKGGVAYLSSAAISGLCKLAEKAGVKVDPAKLALGISVDELKRLIDTIYPKVDEYGKEWLDLLRQALGI
jgi:mRNA-degrading endonuclease RelE of RelBE toxin-antitoxin system